MAAASIALLLLTLLGCGGGEKPGPGRPLRIGLIPKEDPDVLRSDYAVLVDHIERELGVPVELRVPEDYRAVVDAMANDQIDLALFGGLTYVQAEDRAEVSPLVTKVNPTTGDTTYRSVIVVREDSEIERLDQLQRRKFAFGAVSSTSGSLYPARMLQRAGIDFREDLGQVLYTDDQTEVAGAVASGRMDAGAIDRRVLRDLIGSVDGRRLRVIATSEPIEGDPWVVRDSLDSGFTERLRRVFLEMRDTRLLRRLQARGYRTVDGGDYATIAADAEQLGLLFRPIE